MGTAGMRASLISREVIADSIELMARAHYFDAMVCLTGCDKTTPAAAMALARLDRPALIGYSGTVMPGRFRGRDVASGDIYEAVGEHAAGLMSGAELGELEARGLPRAGRLRRPVHREHDVDDDGGPRPVPGRVQLGARHPSRQSRRGRGTGRTGLAGPRGRPAAEHHPDPGRLRERGRRGRGVGRVHQRGPAPAGHRARAAPRLQPGRLRRGVPAHPGHLRPEAGRRLRGQRPARGRRHRDRAEAPDRRRLRGRLRHDRDRADPRRGMRGPHRAARPAGHRPARPAVRCRGRAGRAPRATSRPRDR